MRKVEQQGRAWRNLLKQVEKNVLQLTFRGPSDKEEPLFELKTRTGIAICTIGTEKDLMAALEAQDRHDAIQEAK